MRSFVIVLGLATLLTGCTYSVHPILMDTDLTKDLDLSGTWRADTDGDKKPAVISVEGYADNTSYDVTSEGSGHEFDLRIGKIGDRRILQFIRSNLSNENSGPLIAGLPVFSFARFESRGDELHVFLINEQEVSKLLRKNDIPYRVYDQDPMYRWLVLTARTAELQSLIRDSGDDLFRKSAIIFRRIQSPKEKPTTGTKPQ